MTTSFIKQPDAPVITTTTTCPQPGLHTQDHARPHCTSTCLNGFMCRLPPHERNFLCNHGVCIIHSSQMLHWQATTSAPILHRQHSRLKIRTRKILTYLNIFYGYSKNKLLCRIIMARNGFWPLHHINGKAEIYQNICLSYLVFKQPPV